MKKILFSFFVFVVFASASAITPANAAKAPGSFAPLVEKLSPAVVNISTTQTVSQTNAMPGFKFSFPPGSPFEQFNDLFKKRFGGKNFGRGGNKPPRKATSLGSGFIIDPSGIVVTNNHVVAEADEITVTLQDDTQLEAEIIGRDEKIDIAVLRVKSNKKLPFVEFGDSDKARVGDWIIAIGNPYGLGGSVSAGIISARARDINVGPFDDFLQTDAAINRGNSGGPMFNMKGEVIGVNTAIFSPSGGNVGIGFALPAALAEPVISQILKFGKAKRAWLGVKIQPVTDEIAESLGLEDSYGAMVLEVLKDGPAESAGVQVGDIILKFNGERIESMRKLPRIVAGSPIGDKTVIQVFRNGQVKNLRVQLGELNEEEIAKDEIPEPSKNNSLRERSKNVLGMGLLPLDSEIRNKYSISTKQGLLIAKVNPESDAAEKRLAPGMIIIKANQRSIASVEDIRRQVDAVKKAGRGSILLMIKHGDVQRFVALPVGK